MPLTIVLGAGRTGLAVARYLHGRGVEVVLNDRRSRPARDLEFTLAELGIPGVWGLHPEVLLGECQEIVLSPGIPPDLPFLEEARRRSIPVVGELELAHRALREKDPGAKILAVTGTNGKSTTTDLLAHLLHAAGLPAIACGNLGTPLIEALQDAVPGTRYALECSSYQLETSQEFRAEGAAFLNLTPDHLARHGTMDHYLAAKQRIFMNQRPGDIRVTPATEPRFELGSGSPLRFGWGMPQGDGAWCGGDGMLRIAEGGEVFPVIHRSELRIPGDHNVENALAAMLLARHGGVELEAMRQGLRSYPGLAHRIAFCGEKGGVKAYNDSKGTNVDATLTAVRALPGPLVLLLGGEDKGTSYAPLREALGGKLREAIFLGEAIPQMERDLGDLPHRTVPAFDDAVREALALARSGDQVLLSPACASFDQFENFEQRGKRFEALVKEWIGTS
jgi:UDP-N-acetylmuramoylalanine--D-glutamate ligase